jgi:hypothetical protein
VQFGKAHVRHQVALVERQRALQRGPLRRRIAQPAVRTRQVHPQRRGGGIGICCTREILGGGLVVPPQRGHPQRVERDGMIG